MENTTLKNVLYSIQKQSKLNFIYQNDNGISAIKDISINVKNIPVSTALNQVLNNTNYTYEVSEGSFSKYVASPIFQLF